MTVELIVVPYDSGHRGYRMGRGPEYLLASGLVEQLASLGIAATIKMVETQGDAVQSAFDSARQVAVATRTAIQGQAFPIILAGNCITTLGGFAGLDSTTALLWLDAHADFNTPETSPSGFLDGMALAVITGSCYREEAEQISGFAPLPDSELALLGTRSIDDGEKRAVERVGVSRDQAGLRDALAKLTRPDLYVHVDLDVLDPSALRANQFAERGGLDRDTLFRCLAEAGRQKRVAALAITAYDPDADTAAAGPQIVLDIIRQIALPVPR